MSKKRDTDLKYGNRGNFEQKGPSQVSRATVENREPLDETSQAANPVSSDMMDSRRQAIRTNEQK